jgi:hypothetical protein
MLHQLGEVGTVSEALSNGLDVRPKTVRGDLRLVDDPLPHVIHKSAGGGFSPFTGRIGDDPLAGRVQGDERVLIALVDFMALGLFLFFAPGPGPLSEAGRKC